MAETAMDPMVDIFLEECGTLVEEYFEQAQRAEAQNKWDIETIHELFRITHTIKADATMMLYEDIAVPMRAFEKVLYYYRDHKKEAKDAEFAGLLYRIYSFVKEALQQIAANGTIPEGSAALEQEILSYYAGLEEQEKQNGEEKGERRERAHFYIASDTAEKAEKQTSSVCWKQEESRVEPQAIKIKQRSTLISEEDLDNLQELADRAGRAEASLLRRYNGQLSNMPPEGKELHALMEELYHWLEMVRMVAFEHITVKLRRIIEEMNDALSKEIELVITGDSVLIERNRLEKISGALIHILRNAADHGIESEEERLKAGKSRNGTITVSYSLREDASGIVIEVSDDGRGLNREKIYETALRRGMIKEGTVLSEEETWALIFEPGFTTKEEADEYSGRGVGMDTVKHNMEEIGATVTVSSESGEGAAVRIEMDYCAKRAKGQEEKSDESFDCRR